MKYIATFLSLLCVVGTPLQADDGDSPKPSTAESRADKKAALEWFKNAMKNKQSALKILKKVKDQKSADKAGKDLQKLFGVKGKATAMGETGPAQKPSGAADLEEKSAAKLQKLQELIDAQVERINGLDIQSSELDKGIEAMSDAM